VDKETCWKLYEFEWEQRNALASAVGIPIVAVTAVGGVIATMALSFPYGGVPILALGFIASLVFSTALLITSVCMIFRFLLTASYRKLDSPVKLLGHSKNLVEWHLANDSSREAAIAEFEGQLLLHIASAADNNSRNNEQRSDSIRQATICIASALIFLAIAVCCYVPAQLSSAETVHNVKIVK
jgi:hypothetical protein